MADIFEADLECKTGAEWLRDCMCTEEPSIVTCNVWAANALVWYVCGIAYMLLIEDDQRMLKEGQRVKIYHNLIMM